MGWREVGGGYLWAVYSDPAPPNPGSQNNCQGCATYTAPTLLLKRQLLPTHWQPDCWPWLEPSNLIHLWALRP